ncbi:MAG: MFS transporter [Magnetovibrio sp.]|nr:MFS transporter [Magnetovibrio sp.]
MSATRLIFAVFMAQLLAQIGAYTVPALLPIFITEWNLTNTEAGWLTGMWAAAYVCAVPILVSLTDRIDPKRLYLVCVTLTTLTHLGYAFLADGFWSALFLRALAGMAWAGCYMPGLKVLSDWLEGKAQTRGVSWHAAGVGFSGALSFLFAGTISSFAPWPWVFGGASLCTVAAFLIMAFAVPGQPAKPAPAGASVSARPALFDFRPVLRNRSALAYSIGYGVHCWELFTLRSWGVTFLTFTAAAWGGGEGLIAPTSIAFAMGVLGTWSSVGGNEMCIRFGRQRVVMAVMAVAMVFALSIGWAAAVGYGLAVALCLMYNIAVYADSSALTAGTSGSAEPARRGATLAVHSTIGYIGGFFGPLVFGIVLDLAGGSGVTGWVLAFGHLAIITPLGIAAFLYLRPRDLPGDRTVNGLKDADSDQKDSANPA